MHMSKLLKLPFGPSALFITSFFFIGVVFWGLFNETEIVVKYVDAGPVDRFAIGQVDQVDDLPLYVIGLENGTLRAIDTRLEGSSCLANWMPDDPRGRSINYQAGYGVFKDTCSEKIWAAAGHAIGGDTPLRTPHLEPRPGVDGKQHIFVEFIILDEFASDENSKK